MEQYARPVSRGFLVVAAGGDHISIVVRLATLRGKFDPSIFGPIRRMSDQRSAFPTGRLNVAVGLESHPVGQAVVRTRLGEHFTIRYFVCFAIVLKSVDRPFVSVA